MKRDADHPNEAEIILAKPDLTEAARVAMLRNLLLERVANGESGNASFFDTLYGDL